LTNVNSDLFKHRSSITVHSPDGGEEWEVGTAQAITWSNIGEVGDVRIEYSTNSGETWNTIDSSTDNDGFYRWIIPNDRSEYCKVRVSECGLDDGPADDSDQVFSIVAAANVGITVISPNGSESWAAGSFHNITWTHTGIIGSVMIEYSTNGGNSYTTIVATTPNTGSYGWIVSNAPSQSCLVRVKALDTDGYPVDVSNSTFTITNN